MMDDKTLRQEFENLRQAEIKTILLALLLIERGQIEEAKQALIVRLPFDMSDPLTKVQP